MVKTLNSKIRFELEVPITFDPDTVTFEDINKCLHEYLASEVYRLKSMEPGTMLPDVVGGKFYGSAFEHAIANLKGKK
jgi:hypothetical protein